MASTDAQHEANEGEVTVDVDGLIERFKNLINEIEEYQAHLAQLGRKERVRWGDFDKTVRSDFNAVKKLADSRRENGLTAQALRSSNIPYHEAVWEAAKSSKGLSAFRETFSWRKPPKRWKKAIGTGRYHGKDHAVTVDVVADDGLEWIKVSSLTERRLQFDLAKEGWCASDSGSDDGADRRRVDDEGSEDESGIPILKAAEGLVKAAKSTRVRYQRPRVKILLPRFSSSSPAIDRIFAKIRAKGCSLEVGDESKSTLKEAIEALDEIDDHASLTPVVNIDCTVLLSLVSDISHLKKCDEPWLHAHVKAQVALEQEDQLLSANLYPALANRKLVCTEEAAAQMKTIVETVGNPAESRRRELLLVWDSSLSDGQRDAARAEFASLSEHAMPQNFQMPILVVNKDEPIAEAPAGKAFSSKISTIVSRQLTAVNASVFMYGWRTGRTTITSNQSAVHRIEELINANRESEDAGADEDNDVRGPVAWFIPVARSLVGMDRGRKFLGQNRGTEPTKPCSTRTLDVDTPSG